jgi:hypothetical protein
VEGTVNGMAWYITLFPGITDYILAFFMNLGGNVVSISRIFTSVVDSNNNCDLIKLTYDSGRLARLFFAVKPLEVISAPRFVEHSSTFELLGAAYKSLTKSIKK